MERSRKTCTPFTVTDNTKQMTMEKKLPTLSEMLGLDKYDLTESQRHDCVSLANHAGIEAAQRQAKRFEQINKCEHKEHYKETTGRIHCKLCGKEKIATL